MDIEHLQLKKLITINYKNLLMDSTEGVQLKQLNILIGANGSGKTNLISVLEFLHLCLTAVDESRGMTAYEQAVINQLGGSKLLDANLPLPANASYKFEFSHRDVIPSESLLELTLHAKDSISIPFIVEESFSQLGLEPSYFYRCHHKDSGVGVVSIEHSNNNANFETIEEVPTNELSLLAMPKLLENSHSSMPSLTPIYKTRRRMIDSLSQWRFYNANDMSLKEIRNSYPKIGANDIFLSANGENLPLMLDNLMQHQTYGIDFEEQINNAMKSIFPTTRKIKIYRSNLSLAVQWYFEGMREPFYLNEMSDGSVRMLCWASILHSPILPTLLVIDEPELGLHVAWMQILSEWIKQAATKTQVIVSTHSPDLLDYFTDCVTNVLSFERHDKSHCMVKPLSATQLSDKIKEGWQLGDLYRIGDPDIGGWPW
ncbi:AAA family ATPase [Candidatus Marithrix sp. Canyon 246]|uniref:AAA family ATPase n=1 Tax=Candidatus Marithrix sp. Canyon 246 TaxID=1827136 RepID=UPI00084A298C|nr:AAA family ATPase [Candidatus Marithrix sp. Canyon 246]